MSIKQNGGVFGRNPTFNDVTIEGDLIINGEVFTGLDFQGSWNASTNTPSLASSTGTNGEFYIVSVAGTTDLNGITNWGIGDWAIFNGTVWQRVEGGADGNFNDLTAKNLTVSDTGVPEIKIEDTDGTNKKTFIKQSNGTTQLVAQDNASHGTTLFQTYNGSSTITRQRIASNGDISFYEDTGTTPKLFWDASAESLTVDQRIKVGSTADGIALQIDTGVGSILGVDTGGNGWNDLDIRCQSGTQLYLDTSGSVGIGTSSPAGKIDLGGNSAGTVQAVLTRGVTESAMQVRVLNGDAGATASQGSIGLDYANGTWADMSTIKFLRADSAGLMAFYTSGSGASGTEAMRIDSSGNLLVGKTAVNTYNNTNGIELQASGLLTATRAGIAQILNREDSDGDIAVFRKDGSTVGSIGATQGRLAIGNLDTGLKFSGSDNSIMPFNVTTNANRDNAVDLGIPAVRWKDLYLSGGVYLGGTGAANKLDDYEEGTWTPTVKDNSGNSATASTATGYYTKIGREVHIACELDNIDTTGLVSGDQVRIIGIPFPAATLTNNVQWFNVIGKNNVLTTSDSVVVSIADGFGYVRLKKAGEVVGVWLAVSALTSGTADIKFNLTYFTS